MMRNTPLLAPDRYDLPQLDFERGKAAAGFCSDSGRMTLDFAQATRWGRLMNIPFLYSDVSAFFSNFGVDPVSGRCTWHQLMMWASATRRDPVLFYHLPPQKYDSVMTAFGTADRELLGYMKSIDQVSAVVREFYRQMLLPQLPNREIAEIFEAAKRSAALYVPRGYPADGVALHELLLHIVDVVEGFDLCEISSMRDLPVAQTAVANVAFPGANPYALPQQRAAPPPPPPAAFHLQRNQVHADSVPHPSSGFINRNPPRPR